MIDYLQLFKPENDTRENWQCTMNMSLIEGYAAHCDRNWHMYPNDDYYYHHLIYHAIQAGDNQILREILTNFLWMIEKLKVVKTLFNLRLDIQDYIHYLKAKKLVISYFK